VVPRLITHRAALAASTTPHRKECVSRPYLSERGTNSAEQLVGKFTPAPVIAFERQVLSGIMGNGKRLAWSVVKLSYLGASAPPLMTNASASYRSRFVEPHGLTVDGYPHAM
jgi:hypothetical protein